MHDVSHYRRLLQEQLPLLRHRYHVASLGLFGSYVRGDERSDSDLDVLVTFEIAPSLFGLIELENHLSDELGIKVDLVVRESLKPNIGKMVLQEVVPI
jgi:uncharacterized protein